MSVRTIDDYINYYQNTYGIKPSEKLIESFCKCNGLPLPTKKIPTCIICGEEHTGPCNFMKG